MRGSPRTLAAIAIVAALTATGAFVRIPLYVPITLQVPFVCLGGVWLGPGPGAWSQVVYLTIGLAGFPVFAQGGGIHYLLEPSFGYLLGFPAAAWIAGRLSQKSYCYGRYLLAILASLAPIYLFGVGYLYLNLRYLVGRELSFPAVCQVGLAPLFKDLLLAPLIALAGHQVKRRLALFRTNSGI